MIDTMSSAALCESKNQPSARYPNPHFRVSEKQKYSKSLGGLDFYFYLCSQVRRKDLRAKPNSHPNYDLDREIRAKSITLKNAPCA